jgi:hypothetical protein
VSRQRSLIFWAIPLRKDREHSWKHHARSGSLLYELLGWIDQMAAKKEAETGVRFVFAKRQTLLTKCFKGKRSEGKHYNIRKLDAVLAELREQHIISKYFETADRKWCGFVVAPHDSLCHKERSGQTCFLPDRSIRFPLTFPAPNWRERVLAAAKTAALRQHNGSHYGSERAVITAVITAAVPVIDGSQNGSQNGSDQTLYAANFALLTESEQADWLAHGMQDGSPTRCTRGSLLADEPAYPSDPGAQEALEHHEHFLKSKQRQQQVQPQRQERVSGVVSLEDKPTTAEATPKAKQPGRKRDVLPEFEYSRQKDARALEEWKAEIAARPPCPKCGAPHPPDPNCSGKSEPPRKKR